MSILHSAWQWRRVKLILVALIAWPLLSACNSEPVGPDDDGGSVVDSSAVAFIGVHGAPESGEVYEGHWFQLAVSLFDHRHRAVSGVPIAWWSSDTSKATVAANGFVFAKAAGPVIIWVESQEVQASVELTVVRVPVAAVRIENGDALVSYVSLTVPLTGAALDQNGNVLLNRALTWRSTAPGVASVDGGGVVTPHGQGTARIIATSEGKSDTVTIAVLPKPAADWSRVTDDWGTYQGNAEHTGYVPATLDPAVFAKEWQITPFPGGSPNPPVTGDGKVFISTQAYFGTQKLVTVDAGTGSQLWSYDFGGIHGVHPPAYANGSVYVTTSGHSDSFLWAFSAASGAVRFRSAYGNQWSRYYSPVIVDTTLYMAGGDYDGMYAFSTVDGTRRWFKGLNQYDQWTPAVRDGLVYAYTGSYDPNLTVVDAATGTEVYRIDDPQFGWGGWSMNIAPVLGSTSNVLATQAGRLLSFDLTARTIGWSISGGFTGTPVVANGTIYVVRTGQIEARRESDGALQWVWVPPMGAVQGNLIATDNLLFVSTPTTTYAIDLAAHVSAWSYPSGGHLILSSEGRLLIAESKDGGTVTALTAR